MDNVCSKTMEPEQLLTSSRWALFANNVIQKQRQPFLPVSSWPLSSGFLTVGTSASIRWHTIHSWYLLSAKLLITSHRCGRRTSIRHIISPQFPQILPGDYWQFAPWRESAITVLNSWFRTFTDYIVNQWLLKVGDLTTRSPTRRLFELWRRRCKLESYLSHTCTSASLSIVLSPEKTVLPGCAALLFILTIENRHLAQHVRLGS